MRFLVLTMSLTVAGCAMVGPPETRDELPDPVPVTQQVCEREPELCRQWCLACEDRKACFENNGVCLAGGLHFDDRGDAAADIWTPGCHYEYSDAACTQNQAFFLGDVCGDDNPDELIEWTQSTCHGPTGDRATYDCDRECQKAGLGNGTCVVASNACGAGRHSALCKCDQPLPTP